MQQSFVKQKKKNEILIFFIKLKIGHIFYSTKNWTCPYQLFTCPIGKITCTGRWAMGFVAPGFSLP